jgi:hypothetical protein
LTPTVGAPAREERPADHDLVIDDEDVVRLLPKDAPWLGTVFCPLLAVRIELAANRDTIGKCC